MRNVFGDTFYTLAQRDPRLVMVVADISPAAAMTKFREQHPERFINVGVSEQIMIGLSAGLCLGGMRPFAYTIATFALYRTFEFWRDDLAYQNLPVTIVGIGGGVNYASLGGTHHAMEDVVIAAAVPNMQVIAPCDPLEVKSATTWCAQENQQGPVYLRLGRAGEPNLTEDAEPWVMGKLRTLRKGTRLGLLSYGVVLKMGLDAVAEAEKSLGHAITVVNCHTLKPLDRSGLLAFLKEHDKIVVVEELVPRGSLSSILKALAFDQRLDCDIQALTLQDRFLHVYGSHQDLLAAHGIQVNRIKEALLT